MTATIHTIKDIDGAREVKFQIKGGSLFVWARGADYEFDLGIYRNVMRRVLAMSTEDPASTAGSLA